jgi:hypothetical protein
VLTLKRPVIHGRSFVGFGCGAACLIPLFIWELYARPVMAIDTNNLLALSMSQCSPRRWPISASIAAWR